MMLPSARVPRARKYRSRIRAATNRPTEPPLASRSATIESGRLKTTSMGQARLDVKVYNLE